MMNGCLHSIVIILSTFYWTVVFSFQFCDYRNRWQKQTVLERNNKQTEIQTDRQTDRMTKDCVLAKRMSLIFRSSYNWGEKWGSERNIILSFWNVDHNEVLLFIIKSFFHIFYQMQMLPKLQTFFFFRLLQIFCFWKYQNLLW